MYVALIVAVITVTVCNNEPAATMLAVTNSISASNEL